MNISEINAEHERQTWTFTEYKVAMRSLVKEHWIKNWIEKSNDPYLLDDILKEKAYIRVRHNDRGLIYEMMAHNNGHLCCMFYCEPEEWEILKNIIEERTAETQGTKH